MPLRPESISAIVDEELARVKNKEIRYKGNLLHMEWYHSAGAQNFCAERVIPEIKKMHGRTRTRAMIVFRHIQNRIAELAAQQSLQEEQRRQSPERIKQELRRTFEVIDRMGRGLVVFGSARTKEGHKYYDLTTELTEELSLLLGSTMWSGAGPGQMEAALVGAQRAGGRIAGVKINLDKNSHAHEQDVCGLLQKEQVALCEYFVPRKMGLVDAVMRMEPKDRTGVVITPGGFGTLDEGFELLTLIQTGKLGTNHQVPIALMNYDGFFDHQLQQHQRMLQDGMISPKDLDLYWICRTNREALEHFAEFYEIPEEGRGYKDRLPDIKLSEISA